MLGAIVKSVGGKSLAKAKAKKFYKLMGKRKTHC